MNSGKCSHAICLQLHTENTEHRLRIPQLNMGESGRWLITQAQGEHGQIPNSKHSVGTTLPPHLLCWATFQVFLEEKKSWAIKPEWAEPLKGLWGKSGTPEGSRKPGPRPGKEIPSRMWQQMGRISLNCIKQNLTFINKYLSSDDF